MKTSLSKSKIKSGSIVKYAVPLIISAGLCYLLFTGVDFGQMVSVIRTCCDFRWIALAMCVSIVSFVCRAFRWRIQLRALGIDAPLYALVYSIFGTYSVNLVFPRLGEVWRSGYIAGRQNVSFTVVLGSMMADRLADSLTVLALAVLVFLMASDVIMDYINSNMESYGAMVGFLTSPWLWGILAVTVATLWIMIRRRTSVSWILRFKKIMRDLWNGFAVIVKMKGKAEWLIWTVGIWGCFGIQMYICFLAFPFTREVAVQYGAISVLVTFVLGSISMGVPSNGGIGPWQWAVIFALGIYGVGRSDAAAFANLVLGSQTLMLIVLGIFTFCAIALDRKKQSKKNIKQQTISNN